MTMKPSSITFFCELHSRELERLFASNELIAQLVHMNANISMAIQDFSPERANIVKKLTRAGIPVTAWILLSLEEGYWTSLDTIHQTIQRYSEFKLWTKANQLTWAAIGLDIEPRIDMLTLLKGDLPSQIPTLAKRYFSFRKYHDLESETRNLIRQIHTDGNAVETYQFPSVVEERRARSSVLARLFGLPALDSDREVLMLYSSIFGKAADAVLWSYARDANAIGVGSTGGGVTIEELPPLRSLRWLELKRDLLMASMQAHHIYIFSLEGCVEENLMDRLEMLDWNTPQSVPRVHSREILLIRKAAQAILWSLSHPLLSFAIFFPILCILMPRGRCFKNTRVQDNPS